MLRYEFALHVFSFPNLCLLDNSCLTNIGRKFTQVEVVACLTVVSQNYTIELPKDWTHEMVWKILDKSFSIITLGPPRDIPLVFKRRTGLALDTKG